MNVTILCLKDEYGPRSESFDGLLPLLRHEVPFIDGNCRLTMPVVKGTSARDPLLRNFNIGVLNCVKSNSTAIKYIYNQYVDLIESYAVDFGINGRSTLTEMVHEIGMESAVSRARLPYTRKYLTPGTCSLTKPTAMENWCRFPPKCTQSSYHMELGFVLVE